MLTGISACVFDAYGTLFDVHAAAARCRDDLGNQADRLSALWRQKQLEYTWLRSLMGAYQDFWQITGDGLDYALETCGIDDPALRTRLMDIYRELDAYQEVPMVLSALRDAGLKTAILSNGSPQMLDSAATGAGIQDSLDAIYSVADVGIFKPDRRTYQMAVDGLGAPAAAIAFMSSNAWDVCGAAHFGFQAVWVNRFGQAPERLPGSPKAEIRTLSDLPGLLGA